ncbi:hypothetical protein FQN55_007117 [Onygenales sp. PD_40]|nr:hypothetical protein FQN55_007117 [Onygenales sp. PD_40]KAK2775511.1 hypothetical protein FQN52_003980 [Onygenales sp. PD_12]KAK2807700.1 hypothetical protein FQN51_000137 [Onygenales sp. PD_10]
MRFELALFAAALAGDAAAHTIMTNLVVDGEVYPVSFAVRTPTYDGPITDVASDDVVCNGGPNPTTPSSDIIPIEAGSTIQATWRHTLTSGPEDVIDASHKVLHIPNFTMEAANTNMSKGPVMAYLKKVTDATTDSGVGDGWFKIQETGLSDGVWGVDTLIEDQGLQTITIPACVEPGQYLLRAELIALHAAGSPQGAQLYMECAQIEITGGSGGASPATVSLPGAYSADDPGILINIYQELESYDIPGPEVFSC